MTNDQDLNLEFLRKWYEEEITVMWRESLYKFHKISYL